MALGTVGWLCPKCNTPVSPSETTCPKCAPQPSIAIGTIVGYGTVYAAPPKTDAQKLAEAKADAAKYKRKAERYSEWADKLITFYGQLNDLTQELDDLTDEPDEIESD